MQGIVWRRQTQIGVLGKLRTASGCKVVVVVVVVAAGAALLLLLSLLLE